MDITITEQSKKEPQAKRRKIAYSLLAGAVLLASANAPADEQGGVIAYRQGDYKTAFTLLSEQAQEPPAEIYFLLGQMLLKGQGTAQDTKAGLSWLEKAARRSYAPALYSLAEVYYRGDGVPRDYIRAQEFARQGAMLGDGKAATALGEMYARGVGTPRDYQQAYVWLGTAALEGDAIGSLNQMQVFHYLSPEERLKAEQQIAAYAAQRKTASRQASPLAQAPVRSTAAPYSETGGNAQYVWVDPVPGIGAAAVNAQVNRPQEVSATLLATVAAPKAPAEGAPALSTTPGTDVANVHVVKPGETVYSIARQISTQTTLSLSDALKGLKKVNPSLAADRGLRTGESLRLPSSKLVGSSKRGNMSLVTTGLEKS